MQWIFVCMLILVFLIALVGAVIWKDTHRFVQETYIIASNKLKKSGRMVMLSDLHCSQFGEKNEKLLAAIKEVHPEHILIVGDMITATPGADMSPGMNFVKELAKKYPVTYAYGNHEYRLTLYPETYGDMWERFDQEMKDSDIVFLRNDKRLLDEWNIDIYGLEIDREYYKRFRRNVMEREYIFSKLGTPDQDKYNILLAHNPVYFPYYAKWGADLTLSGHVHGGIARLPILGGMISPSLRLFPKYDGGRFEENGKTMILGRGLGTHTIPIRFLNPGEIVVLELRQCP